MGIISIAYDVLYKVKNSTNPDIVIAGIPTRKESLAAVLLLIPENNAEVKVIPDLETPGNIARDCEIPNKTISLSLISLKDFFLLPYNSERANKKDITIEIIAIENKLLKGESVKPDQNNLINKPINNIGILAIIIKVASLVFSSLKNL